MMPRKLRVLSASDVTAVLGMGEVLELVEQAFCERERGRVQMPPKSYLFFGDYEGDLRVMPAFLCVGADAPGKQELESGILKRARMVIDDWEQASHSGEINVPLSRGEIQRADVCAEIGDIVAGSQQGRTEDSQITLFDTTGLAIQDVICAWKVYEVAEEKKLGIQMDSLYS